MAPKKAYNEISHSRCLFCLVHSQMILTGETVKGQLCYQMDLHNTIEIFLLWVR